MRSLEVDALESMNCSEKGESIKYERPVKLGGVKIPGKQKKGFVLTAQPKET